MTWVGDEAPSSRLAALAHDRIRTAPLRSNDAGGSGDGCDERLVPVTPSDLVADVHPSLDDLEDLAFPGGRADVDGVDDDPITTPGSGCG